MRKYRENYKEERRLLKKAMLNKKLVVFVGAGVSIESGMPSWRDSIQSIVEKLGVSNNEVDYLKVPQFYYKSRGKKEYVELMREIFKYDENLEISDTHRNIIKLNAHTVITTNYDNLIEKAAAENSEFIQVISQDKDLPYRTVEKELIKMHGDFQHNNFVLKENDYLHYSKNFKLIEAYIKSLIATNVVLFLGYSFNDPDVKQIFVWIKDILEDDFQKAYMLEVCKPFDTHEYEYYKNLGVNIVYASEIHEDFEKENAIQYTNDFLQYILEEDQYENKLDLLFSKVEAYRNLNYISESYINRALWSVGCTMENGVVRTLDCDNKDNNELLKKYLVRRKMSMIKRAC